MKDFKKRFSGGRVSAGGGQRGGRDFGGKPEMHSAICAACNKNCEVPFKPNGKKEVFCRDCFSGAEESAPRSFDRAPKFERIEQKSSGNKKELDIIITKLDKLISLLENR